MTLAWVCGCGPSGPERVVVSGTVTYQGKPIEQGSVRFLPIGDTHGPASGGAIRDGKYEVTVGGGVLVGTHRVEITAVQPRRDPLGRDLAALEGAGVQYLPEKYNRQSTLTVTIESGSPAAHDFELK